LKSWILPVAVWAEYATELPKTATGKIQRFKLRA